MNAHFSIGSVPKILFGEGRVTELPALAARYGRRIVLVTGHRSFKDSAAGGALTRAFSAEGFFLRGVTISGEPSPDEVDLLVRDLRQETCDVVIGIGGGSVLDAAKAIAGLLPVGDSVMNYLEGVGPEKSYEGPSTPFIAVPTTAGTGSEATRNAVLTRQGPKGFKKSFRDDALMARYAVVDPDLLAGCPKPLIAANGMDALTQLLESYVSLRANPMTDALALSGIAAVSRGLMPWFQGEDEPSGRSEMAYAALLSGICLAQAGLGSVHGLAQPLGSFFPIGHGVVCGSLLAEATAVNLEVMTVRSPQCAQRSKYAQAARVFLQMPNLGDDAALDQLLVRLREMTVALGLPKLSALGIAFEDFDRIVAHSRGSSMQTNPVHLEDAEIRTVLERCY